MIPAQYLVRPLPEALQPLADLAMDLRWHSDHEADEIWRTIDPELWDATGNPWLILIATSARRLETLARDAGFVAEMNRLTGLRHAAMQPVLPLRDEAGEWVRVELELPGRTLYLRGWEARVGRVLLYLLDSNDPLSVTSRSGPCAARAAWR